MIESDSGTMIFRGGLEYLKKVEERLRALEAEREAAWAVVLAAVAETEAEQATEAQWISPSSAPMDPYRFRQAECSVDRRKAVAEYLAARGGKNGAES